MRLWSIHPRYLDRIGLIALWREGLLAQKVLAGRTRGYKHHPQLIRFRQSRNPLSAIGHYLHHIELEARARNYHFDRSKILRPPSRYRLKMKVTRGQLQFESEHLFGKLAERSPEVLKKWAGKDCFTAHPCFRARRGDVEVWEKHERD